MTNDKVKEFNGQITVICGEYSGEIHAANLVNHLRSLIDATFYAVGSTLLKKEGADIVFDYREISVTGLAEVFKKIVSIKKAYNVVKRHVRMVKPSLIILVDFPGFNLRIAKMAKKQGIPVVYYIPPQLWAWGKGRIKHIKAYVDLVICLFPFEKRFYDTHGVRSEFVGHPFLKMVGPRYERERFLREFNIPDVHPIIAILPGSRPNEVTRHMPSIYKVIEEIEAMFKESFFIIAQAHGIDRKKIEMYVSSKDRVRIVQNFSHDVLFHSDCAILASGSVTLEAALLGVPSVVIYKLSPISYLLGKIIVEVPYVSLPNIILGEEVFPEFIQNLDTKKIAVAVSDMLKREKKEEIMKKREFLIDVLGGLNFDSYGAAAKKIFDFLREIYGFVPEAA